MVELYFNSVRASDPCTDGTLMVTVERVQERVYSGTGPAVSRFLENNVLLGQSVEIRHAKGIRSCMNKPGLWVDCMGYE